MEDFLPSAKDLISNLVWAALATGFTYLWNRVRALNASRIPLWVVYGLALYAVLTLSYFFYNYYQTHRDLKLIQNQIFDHQTIVLDGIHFDHCNFISCKFLMKGRDFGLSSNHISGDYRFEFTQESSESIQILMKMKQDSAFTPLVNDFLKKIMRSNSIEDLDLNALPPGVPQPFTPAI